MQKLVYDKTKNTINLIDSKGDSVYMFNGVVSVDQDGNCFVVKKVIGNDPRPTIVMMVPVNNTNYIIER